jgi:hypothetical protein
MRTAAYYSYCTCYGRDTPDAIRQHSAIFRFLLTDNFDTGLSFSYIWKRYNIFSYLVYVSFKISFHWQGLKVQTHRTRFDNATRFFSFWKLIKQPMRAKFKRYVDQITRNVITLLNNWKFKLGSKLSVSENRKIASRCRIASGVYGPLRCVANRCHDEINVWSGPFMNKADMLTASLNTRYCLAWP